MVGTSCDNKFQVSLETYCHKKFQVSLVECDCSVFALLQPTMMTAQDGSAEHTQTSTDNYQSISRANAKNLNKVARFGRGKAQSIAWSPDGKWIAIGADMGYANAADDCHCLRARRRTHACIMEFERKSNHYVKP